MKQKTVLQQLIEELEDFKHTAEVLYEKLNRTEEKYEIQAYVKAISAIREKLPLEQSQIKEAYEAGQGNIIEFQKTTSLTTVLYGEEYFTNTFEQ